MHTHKFPLLLLVTLCFTFAATSLVLTSTAATTRSSAWAVPQPSPPGKAAYGGYRGVMIGIPAEEARKKLGDPKDKSETQDFYVYGTSESAQVFYDKEHNVSLVSVSYIGKVDTAPTAKDVFGEEVAANPDGSIFKSVRYPKAGYWIAYNRTAGDEPMVTVTIQKLQGP